ncbi:hypothetical protein DIPPA_07771 [Diplonema papillatum]|nr:hypothetical protein DIPPA_07771 [Diplonema papillatum]
MNVVFAGTPSGQIAVYPFPIVGPAPCLVLDAHTKPVIFVVLSVDERLLITVVFAGTPSGQIAVYPFPIVGPAPCLVLDAHTKPVIFVVLSVDERLLITVSEDLSLFVFEIASPSAGAADVGAGKVSKNGKQFLVPALNEVMCTLQVDLDQQLKAIDQLTRLNEELRSTRTHRMHTLKEECKEQVSRKRAATQKAVEECYQQKHAADTEAQQTVENAAKSRTEAEALHKEAAVRLDRLFEAQVEAMAECCSRLQHERDDAVAGYENEIHRLNKEWTKDRDRRIASLEQVEAQASAQLQAIADEKNDLSADGEARIGQLEREYESDLTQVKKDYAGKQAKRDAQYEADMLNYTAGVRVQEKNALEVEKLLRDVKARDEVLQKATARNKDLEKANDALRLEIDVRIDTTVSSERKTHDLKHHTAELEKLRYVLSFKFSELRREVAPKEKQIAFIEKKIDEMQFELEKVATDIAHLQRDVRRMETKAGGLRREIDRCAEELEQKESIQKGLHRKLIGVLEAATQRTILRGVRDLVEEFALYQGSPSSSVPSAAADYHRKRTYVEKQLSSTKKQSSRRKANLEHASQRKTVENSILVREINELRHEKKSLMEKLDHTDAAVRELRAKLAALGFSASQQRSSPMAARPNSAFAPATPMTSASQAQLPTSPTPPVPPGLRLKAGKRDFLASNAGTLAQLARLDAVNITEVIQQVEANNLHMEKQQAEILKLRDFVAHLLARSKLEDAPSDEQAKVYDDIKAAFLGSQ